MKKLQPIYALLLTLFLLYAFSSSPPVKTTGAPGEGNCTDCHIPNNSGLNGVISIQGLPSVIIPGTTYNLSLTNKVTNGSPAKSGFQMVILDDANNNAGVLNNEGANSEISDDSGKTYFGHRNAPSFNGADSIVWTVDWTAPMTLPNDSIKVYINSILGNGSGSAGDLMLSHKSSYEFQATPPSPLMAEVNVLSTIPCAGDNNGTAVVSTTGGTGTISFAWSNNAMTDTIRNLTAGIYTVTATDETGMADTLSVEISEPSPLVIAVDSLIAINCINTNGFAAISISGGTAPYTYNWSNGIMDSIATLTGGIHTITITDANNCQLIESIMINENIQTPAVNVGEDIHITCADMNIDSVQLDGSNTEMGDTINYLWTTADGNILSGAMGLMPMVNASGTYILTATNTVNGCTASDTLNVSFDTLAPIANAGADIQLNCTNITDTLDATGSSQGADFIYNWTTSDGNIMSGAMSEQAVVSSAGTYILTVSDTTNSCSATDTVLVSQEADVPLADAGLTMQLNCNNDTLTLNGSGSMGDSIIYYWTRVDGHIIDGDSTLTPRVDSAGTYVLTVQNTNNNCMAMSSVLITEDFTNPTLSIATPNMLTCSNPTDTLRGSGDTGTNFLNIWTTMDGNIMSGDSTLNPIINAAGTYTLTITNLTTGCQNTASVVVMQNIMTPDVNAGADKQLDCTITTVTLDGTGNQDTLFTHLWTTMDGNIMTGDSTLNPIINAAGTYILTITNEMTGCFASDTAVVTLDAAVPVVSVNADTTIDCMNDTLQITGNASMSTNIIYAWTTMNGQILGDTSALNIAITAVGVYTLTATDTTNHCSANASFTVTMANAPIADAGMDAEINCANPTITLDASNSAGDNLSYNWITEDGNITAGANTTMPTVDEAGLYILMITDTVSTCVATDTVEITESQAMDLFAASGDAEQLTCIQSSITLNANASQGENIIYKWTTEGGNIVEGANTLMPVIDAPGKYTLMVQDTATGCIAESSIKIAQDIMPPSVSAGDSLTLDCNTTSIMLNGSSSTLFNLTYAWTTENGNIIAGASTPNPEVNAAGVYTLTVTDTFTNCSAMASVSIGQDADLPIVNAGSNNQLDCNTDTLTLNGSGSMGTNYISSWATTNGNILGDSSILEVMVDAPGMYTLTITDTTSGCTNSANIEVIRDVEKPMVEAGAAEQFICGDDVLSINGTASTGDHFSYFWCTTDGSILSGAEDLNVVINGAGLFEFIVTNTTNACKNVDTVMVTAIDGITLTLDTMSAGAATVSIVGGTAPYNYLWNTENMDTTANISGQQAGNYMVTATDTNGCMDTLSIDLELSTSLADLEAVLNTFEVYPNPAYNDVNVNIDFAKQQVGQLSVLNKIGQQVWQGSFSGKNVNYQIATDNWAAGLYLIMLQTSDGIKTKQLIVTK